MSVKSCLITAAGLGTRMGEIGLHLPKVVWPIFEIAMIDLQIARAKELGCKTIYINLHHQHQLIAQHLMSKNYVGATIIPVIEEELLDVGGAIYNVAKLCQERLLILNGDMFLFDKDQAIKTLLNADDCEVALISIPVESHSHYNRLVVKDGALIEIRPPNNDFLSTYSGIAVIDCQTLEKRSGKQSFFKSIADFTKKRVKIIPTTDFEYWDFGTKKLYADNLFKVLSLLKNDVNSDFLDFLKKNSAVDSAKISPNVLGYGTGIGTEFINLSSVQNNVFPKGTICISKTSKEVLTSPFAICFEEIVDFY